MVCGDGAAAMYLADPCAGAEADTRVNIKGILFGDMVACEPSTFRHARSVNFARLLVQGSRMKSEDTHMEDNSSNVTWFLAGAAVGAALGILFAPKSGSETRKYIKNSTLESREAMENGGKDLMDKGKDIYDRGRKIADEASELFERGRKLVQG